MFLSPTKDFYSESEEEKKDIRANNNQKKALYLYSYLNPYKRHFLLLLLILILGSSIQIALPFLTQAIVDVGIKGGNINIIILILLGQIAIETGYTVMGVYRNWILLKIGSGLNISMISDYLYKLMRLPMSFFDKKQTGDILQRINDHNRIQKFLTDSILNVLLSAISIIIFGIAICIYNWFVFLMFISGSILYVVWILR